MNPERVNFECATSELTRERRGYFDAFSKLGGARLSNPQAAGVGAVSDEFNASGELVLYPDSPNTPVPDHLTNLKARTACFQIDTFSKPKWKALWSTLFDYVFVFHPGFESYFAKQGHPRVFLLPHAVAGAAYDADVEKYRDYQIAWAGRTDGELYRTRRKLLPELAARYGMNDWQRAYAESEIPHLYRRTRVVVNLGRDDYPRDANLRCFEAMASGALLVTSLPTELELLGFKNGVHFVGYSDERELFQILDYFLRDEAKRKQIAETARALVMREHTYDARARTMLQVIERDAGALFAPARAWSTSQVGFVYLHYHCKHGDLSGAKMRLRHLLRDSPLLAFSSLPLLLRCWQHQLAERKCNGLANV